LDLGILVVPAELRALAAAGRVASVVGMVLRDLRVAVRGPYAPGLDDREVARLLGLPLVGEVPVESSLQRSHGGEAPPGAAARGPLARFCKEFWERALVEAGVA
ncbi:septum formation initiator, partial [Streptomyces sp. NPDC057253]